jgi:hypothetical protein
MIIRFSNSVEELVPGTKSMTDLPNAIQRITETVGSR